MLTIQQIQNEIAAQIKKETSANVEITMRANDNWTISGDSTDEVRAAIDFMTDHIGWALDSIDVDDECGTFAYMHAA